MLKKMNFVLSLITALTISSCSHTTEKTFQKHLASKKCDEASLSIPSFQLRNVKSHLEVLPGKSASYVLTSGAYGVDIAYFVTGGIILPLLVCAPVAALENPLATVTNIPYKSEKGEKCFEVVHSATQKYDSLGDRKNLGGKVYEQTRSWRCPNIDPAVDQILKVAHCFQSKGDITKALEQLKLLADEDAYGGCISSEKRNEIEDKINSIRN